MGAGISAYIDLLDFFKTAEFGSLKLGQTKEWIKVNFAKPDEVHRNNDESPVLGSNRLVYQVSDRLK